MLAIVGEEKIPLTVSVFGAFLEPSVTDINVILVWHRGIVQKSEVQIPMELTPVSVNQVTLEMHV